MPTLLELTAEIVAAHVSNTQMGSDEMLQEIQKVYGTLKALEGGVPPQEEPEKPKQMTIKQAFKKDEVICMICGKGFTTLKRHLSVAHDLKPGQYRKQFNIPSKVPLAAKSYSESRRQAAQERGLSDVLAKAREKRGLAKKTVPPVKKAKAPVPAVKQKAQVPMLKDKVPVPTVAAKPARTKKKPADSN